MPKIVKLNVQGLARRDKQFQSCLIPDPGNVIVSTDMSAGEPTITTQFSKDKNYYDACFGMVGKPPYYDRGTLKIDDIYLMVMSTSPLGADTMREAFQTKWRGISFADQWLEDPEVLKKELGGPRSLHKMLTLATGYGMGSRKMVKQCYDNGMVIDFKDAKEFRSKYWQTFPGVKRFADYCSYRVKRDGFLVNPFGYRLTSEPHKAFNHFIQSSVSGIFHVFSEKVFSVAEYADFLTVIHDELLSEIARVKIEAFRQVISDATDSINEDLGWSVDLRFGFVVGNNWYEAK